MRPGHETQPCACIKIFTLLPANVGAYIVRPLDAKNERQLATLKALFALHNQTGNAARI